MRLPFLHVVHLVFVLVLSDLIVNDCVCLLVVEVVVVVLAWVSLVWG